MRCPSHIWVRTALLQGRSLWFGASNILFILHFLQARVGVATILCACQYQFQCDSPSFFYESGVILCAISLKKKFHKRLKVVHTAFNANTSTGELGGGL